MTQAVICPFFGRLRDRFCEYGDDLNVIEKLERIAQIPSVEGVEMVYPHELGNLGEVKAALERLDLAVSAVNVNVQSDPEFVVIGPKWQSCTTFGTSFGYLEGDRYKDPERVIHEMIETISRNGNFLINISPKSDGTIPEPQVERLQTMGRWLKINGEAIYSTRYWKESDQTTETEHIVFTSKGKRLYAIQLSEPTAPFIIKGTAGWKADQVKSICLLGSKAKVVWVMTPQGLKITPPKALGDSFFAWSFEILTDTGQHHPNVIINDADRAPTGTRKVDLEGKVK